MGGSRFSYVVRAHAGAEEVSGFESHCRLEAVGGLFAVQQATVMRVNYRLNMALDLQSLFGLHVHTSCTYWLRPRNTTPAPPSARIWAHIRGRSWLAKIDDVSL